MAKTNRKRVWTTLTDEQVAHLELAAARVGLKLPEFIRFTLISKANETIKDTE